MESSIIWIEWHSKWGKKITLDDLLDAIYSLTRSLSQSKRNNVHLNKLVGILE